MMHQYCQKNVLHQNTKVKKKLTIYLNLFPKKNNKIINKKFFFRNLIFDIFSLSHTGGVSYMYSFLPSLLMHNHICIYSTCLPQ